MDTNVVNTAALSAAWTSVITFVPKFLAFLFILIVGYFVAKALGGLIAKALNKVKFDDAINRSGMGDALGRAGFRGSELVGRISYYGLMLLVLQLAFSVFGPNAISDLLTRTIAYLPNLFVALVITVVAFTVAGGVKEIVSSAIGGLGYGKTLANLAAGAILVIGIFAALTQLNVATPIILGLYYAMLAVIVGSAIVAIGGGGIVPLRAQWEKALTRASEEAPKLRMEVENARSGNGSTGRMPTAEERFQPTDSGVRAAQTAESFDEYGRRVA
jgi:hypothetical protein